MKSRKPNLLPGLLAGLLPLVLQPFMAIALLFVVGGTEGLARTATSAGEAFYLLVLVSLVFTLLQAFVLFLLGRGAEVPLLVPVGLALVPWLAGIAGSLYGARTVIQAVVLVNPRDLLHILMAGTSEIHCAKLLGAWSSAALLLSTVGALVLSAVWREAPAQEPGRSAPSDRIFEAGAVLLLALLALAAAFEASGTSEILNVLGNVNESDQGNVLHQGVRKLHGPLMVRYGAVGALCLLALVLGGWRLRPRARSTGALVFLVPLALVVAGTLWADRQPALRMARAMEQANQWPPELEGLRLLPFGVDQGFEKVEALATARGLSQPGGTVQPWSMDDQRLLERVAELTGNTPGQQRRPQQTLTLVVDPQLPVTELRRLLEAGARVGLTSLRLVAAPNFNATHPREPWDEGHQHFLSRLAGNLGSRPGIARVLLPPALEESELRYKSTWWVGELGAQPQLRVSSISAEQDGAVDFRVLELKGYSEDSPRKVSDDAVLYLTVSEAASTEGVAHAVREARAHGFRVLLSTGPLTAEQFR